jgi:hypothetical protein
VHLRGRRGGRISLNDDKTLADERNGFIGNIYYFLERRGIRQGRAGVARILAL